MSARHRDCVFCYESTEHYVSFTTSPLLQSEWISLLSGGDPTKIEELRNELNREAGRSYLCRRHFPDGSFISTSNATRLRVAAKPYVKGSPSTPGEATVEGTPVTDSPSVIPSSTPKTGRRTLSKQNISAKALRYDPLQSRKRDELCDDELTRAEYVTNKRQERQDMDWDHTTVQKTGTITYPDPRKYAVVDTQCLAEVFLSCIKGCGDTCEVKVLHEGPITNIRAFCKDCSYVRKWSSSPLLKTKAAGKYEQLHELNMDVVCATMSTTYGYGAIAGFMKTLRCAFPSPNCFNLVKNRYLTPAVDKIYEDQRLKVIAIGEESLKKGEKLSLSGDAQFDTRGFSAIWGRYVITLFDTGLILSFNNVSKRIEGTTSHRLECMGLKRCLEEIRSIYKDYADPIGTLITDRHGETIKWMSDENPSIQHKYDPWHFCRNILLQLLKVVAAKCRKSLIPWIPFINNHIWWAITSSTSAQEVKEKYLSVLYHVRGIHAWPQDRNFTVYKGCTSHSGYVSRICCLDKTSKSFQALEKIIRTDSYLDAISSVSPTLGTAQIEGFNHIATLHEPKDRYFELQGHNLRTKIAIIRHNEAQFDSIAGLRDPSIKRRYYHKTLKCYKDRLVRPAPTHRWRNHLREEMYAIRRNLDSARDSQWNAPSSNPATPTTPSTAMAAFSFDDVNENGDDEDVDEMNEEAESQMEVMNFTDRLYINALLELDGSDSEDSQDSDLDE